MTIRALAGSLTVLLSAFLAAGCQRGSGSGDVAQTDSAANPSSSAGSSGEVKQPGTNETESPAAAAHDAAARPNEGQRQGDEVGNGGPPQGGTHVGRKTDEIVNVAELKNDPNWTVVASDPQEVKGFSIAGTAYNRAAALAGMAPLDQWISFYNAENGKYPTYSQLKEWMAQNRVDMPALREYQHYGYDEATGNVVIVENTHEKEARRKELGLSPSE